MRALTLTLLLTCLSPGLRADDGGAPAVTGGGLQLFEPLAEQAPNGNAGMFVGINAFSKDDGLQTLSFAVHDAIETAYAFTLELKLIPPQNCHLLLSGEPSAESVKTHLAQLKQAGVHVSGATKTDILTTLLSVSELATAPGEMLVCSFSTHGFEDRGDPYVMPSDGFRRLLADTAVRLKTIESAMQESTAGHRLLLVDACQERLSARSFTEAGKPAASAFAEALRIPTGQAKLASCSPGEFSFEHGSLGGVGHGVFTWQFLEALRGGARADEQNVIRLGAVADYVAKNVSGWTTEHRRPKQTPFLQSPVETRQLPLATKADDLKSLIVALSNQPAAAGFDAALKQQIVDRLQQLDVKEPLDRELLASTRDFVAGRLGARLYVPYARSVLDRPVMNDPDYIRGLALFSGMGTPVNEREAYDLFLRAAGRGHALAMTFVGDQNLHGTGVPVDRKEADRWYRKAMPELQQLAEGGNAIAQVQFGFMIQEGFAGWTADLAAAVEWYRKAAEQGDAIGQFNYAAALEAGAGVEQNFAEALKQHRLAAEQGLIHAKRTLYLMYSQGNGVPQDWNEALRWLRDGVQQKDYWSLTQLGGLHYQGLGVEQDNLKAVELYRQAIDLGSFEACWRLGEMYYSGYGVEQDYAKAVEMFEKSAEGGDASGQVWLAKCCYEGSGRSVDDREAVKWIRRACDQGETQAYVWMSVLAAEGRGVPQDQQEAVNWARKAADAGNPWGQLRLGTFYLHGEGVEDDDAKAVELFRLAAAGGDSDAQNWLGRALTEGWGTAADPAEAAQWLEKAAAQGHNVAQYNLALLYRNNEQVRDYAKALQWMTTAAENGHTEAPGVAGLFYYYGQGVPEDNAKALEWFQKGAALHDPFAQMRIGMCYYFGYGVAADNAEALRWFELAADQELAEAQSWVGYMHLFGYGVPENNEEALRWFTLASDQGHAESRNYIGQMHAHGWGVPQNDAEAVKWFRLAADAGWADAQCWMGVMYSQGRGVAQDYAEAVRWWKLAVDNGDPEALYNLGYAYETGRGVERDLEQAIEWYRYAARQKSKNQADAQGALKRLGVAVE